MKLSRLDKLVPQHDLSLAVWPAFVDCSFARIPDQEIVNELKSEFSRPGFKLDMENAVKFTAYFPDAYLSGDVAHATFNIATSHGLKVKISTPGVGVKLPKELLMP